MPELNNTNEFVLNSFKNIISNNPLAKLNPKYIKKLKLGENSIINANDQSRLYKLNENIFKNIYNISNSNISNNNNSDSKISLQLSEYHCSESNNTTIYSFLKNGVEILR